MKKAIYTYTICQIIYCLGVFLFLGHAKTYAQSSLFFNINKKNGMPSNAIFDMYIDSQGRRWFGTDQGLYVHNGFKYEQIQFINNWSNAVTNINEDSQGNYWCRNFSGQIFKLEDNQMVFQEKIYALAEGFHIKNIIFNQESIIILTDKKIIVYSLKESTLAKEIIAEENQTFHALNFHKNHIYIIYNNNYLAKIIGNKIEKIAQIDPEIRTPMRLESTKEQLYIVGEKKQSIQTFLVNEKEEISLFCTINNKENIQIINTSSSANLLQISTNNQAFTIDKNKKIFCLSTQMRMSDFAVDSSGVYIFSSLDNGIYQINSWGSEIILSPEKDTYFEHIFQTKDKNFLLSSNKRSIYLYDQQMRFQKKLSNEELSDIQFISIEPHTEKIYHSNGIVGSTLNFYFGKTVAFTEKLLFVGYHTGLYIFEKELFNDSFFLQKIKNSTDFFQTISPYKLRSERVREVKFIDKNKFVCAYSDSLIMYEIKEEKIVYQMGWKIFGTDLATDDKGRWWVSSTTDGVYCFEDKKLIHHFKIQEEIIGNICKHLAINKNYIAVLTEKGINVIENNQNLTIKQSLYIDLSQTVAYDLAWKNDTLLATIQEGIAIYPLTENSKHRFNNMVFHGILLNEKKIDIKTDQPFEIPYNFRSLSFLWDNIAFNNNVFFCYQLHPLQENPVKIDGQIRQVNFHNLPAGQYRFELFTEVDGKRNVFTSYCFSVPKPWYWQWWFILISSFSVFFISYLYIRSIFKKAKRKQAHKERLINWQLTAIRSQMNPHFLYNALNSLQGMIYEQQVNQAALYVSKFSDYLRQVLNNSSKQKLSIKEEIENLNNYISIEFERFNEDFYFQVKVNTNVDTHQMIPTMIIQPFVENAIKHGLMNKPIADKKLHIDFSQVDQTIVVSIIDNGIGIKAAEKVNQRRINKPSSFATKAIDDRIELINLQKELHIAYQICEAFEQSEYPGTKVTIFFKFLKK